MPTTLPYVGRPYGLVSPTAVPDYQDLLNKVLGAIPTGVPGRPTAPTLPSAPDFQGLLNLALQQVPRNLPSFQDVLSQGISSPILQSILGPALQNLVPGEEVARRNLSDEFRGAGALGGGAFGVAKSRLENSLQGQRGNLISQVIQGLLPTIVSGYAQQSKNILDPAQLSIQSILGSLGPLANLYGTQTGAITNLYGTEANLYGTETRNLFQPASLLSEVLRSNRPELVSGVADQGGIIRGGDGIGASSIANRNPLGIDPDTGRQYGFERGMINPYPPTPFTPSPPPSSSNPLERYPIGNPIGNPTPQSYNDFLLTYGLGGEPPAQSTYRDALDRYNRTQGSPRVSGEGDIADLFY